MQLSPQEISNRLRLLDYLHGMAYLYHQTINSRDKNTIVSGSPEQLQITLSSIAYKFDISKELINKILKGDTMPLRHLVYILSKVVYDQNSLKRFLKATSYLYHFKISRELTGLVNSNSKISEKYLDNCAFQYHLPKRIFSRLFKKAGYPVLFRLSLDNYFRAVVHVKGRSLRWLSSQMGMDDRTLSSVIHGYTYKSMLNALQQIPFVIGVPMNDIKDILHGSLRPQRTLLRAVNSKVRDRKGLRLYLDVFAYINDVSINKLSTAYLHRSSGYLRGAIECDSGEKLSDMLCKFARLMCVPNSILLSALARANVKSGKHAYQGRMRFVVRYDKSPVSFKESPSNEKNDRDNALSSIQSIKESLKNHSSPHSFLLESHFYQVIFRWGQLYAFNADKFMKDNFPHYDDIHTTTCVRQGKAVTPIEIDSDWLVLLRKIQYQLDKSRKTFSLAELQRSAFSPYIYVKGVNLKKPYDDDANLGLEPLVDKGRFTFRGHFKETSFKVIPQFHDISKEIYHPILSFTDITCNGKPVARQVWLNYVSGFTKLGQLQQGDLVSFTARANEYRTGKITKDTVKRINFRLLYPSDIKIVRRHHARETSEVPTNQMELTGYAIEANKSNIFDFTGRNYKYARYCLNRYNNWKRKQRLKNH